MDDQPDLFNMDPGIRRGDFVGCALDRSKFRESFAKAAIFPDDCSRLDLRGDPSLLFAPRVGDHRTKAPNRGHQSLD